jgi:hypothetical protein
MFASKACPRCHGDIYRNREAELTCLQCGYELAHPERAALLARLATRRPQPQLQAA